MKSEKIKIEKKSAEEDKIILEISGRIDTRTAPQLQEAVDNLFKSNVNKITIDIKNVEYISSAGLRVLLYAQKQINSIELKESDAVLEVINVNDSVKEIFDMTGFTNFLNIRYTK
jgi:anti-sigma B factor antagonist